MLDQLDELAADFVGHPEQIGHYAADLAAAGMLSGAERDTLFDHLGDTMGPAFAHRAFAISQQTVASSEMLAADIAADWKDQRASMLARTDARESIELTSSTLPSATRASGLNPDTAPKFGIASGDRVIKGAGPGASAQLPQREWPATPGEAYGRAMASTLRAEANAARQALVARIADPDADRAQATDALVGRMAPALGLNPSEIHVHADDEARRRTEAHDALGLMEGGNVYLHPTRSDPRHASGRDTLAHELVHVAQRNLPGGGPGQDVHTESEAHGIAAILATGGAVRAPQAPLATMARAAKPQKGAARAAAKQDGASASAAEKKGKPSTKKVGRGYIVRGGGRVRDVLTRLVKENKLKTSDGRAVQLTAADIALVDAASVVESGGRAGCANTWDSGVVSVGFKQVTLETGSLQKLIKKAPAGFAKHGIALDEAKTYTLTRRGEKRTVKAIAGVEDAETLRSLDWAKKFYAAGLEPDVLAEMTVMALAGIKGTVGRAAKKAGSGAGSTWDRNIKDPTVVAWLYATYNNRPVYLKHALRFARKAGAGTVKSRDEFLDAIVAGIKEAYETYEPKIYAYKGEVNKEEKKLKRKLTKEEKTKLIAAIGRRKAKNITSKIPRTLGAKSNTKATKAPDPGPDAGAHAGPQPADSTNAVTDRLANRLPCAMPQQFAGRNREDSGPAVQATAADGVRGSGAPLPFLVQLQRSFGRHDVSDVRAHVGGAAAEANRAMGSRAYASGNDVAFGGSPDLHTAAHEAAHVVQQRKGVALKDGVGRAGDVYERHADAVADAVVAGRSAESLLDQQAGAGASAPPAPLGGAVQKKDAAPGKPMDLGVPAESKDAGGTAGAAPAPKKPDLSLHPEDMAGVPGQAPGKAGAAPAKAEQAKKSGDAPSAMLDALGKDPIAGFFMKLLGPGYHVTKGAGSLDITRNGLTASLVGISGKASAKLGTVGASLEVSGKNAPTATLGVSWGGAVTFSIGGKGFTFTTSVSNDDVRAGAHYVIGLGSNGHGLKDTFEQGGAGIRGMVSVLGGVNYQAFRKDFFGTLAGLKDQIEPQMAKVSAMFDAAGKINQQKSGPRVNLGVGVDATASLSEDARKAGPARVTGGVYLTIQF